MTLRDKLAAAAGPHLQPGEQVQGVAAAVAVSPWWSLLSYWIILAKNANRAIVATDRRILLFRTSRWRFTAFKQVLADVPRSTVFGEPSGLNWRTDVLGTPLWINKRFHRDLRAIDAAVLGAAPPPSA